MTNIKLTLRYAYKQDFCSPVNPGQESVRPQLILLQQQNSPASNETWRPFYSMMGIVCDKVISREYDTFTTDVHNHDSFLFTSEECARFIRRYFAPPCLKVPHQGNIKVQLLLLLTQYVDYILGSW